MTQKKTVDERAGSGGEEMRCTWYLEMMRNVAIFYYQTADEVKKKQRRGGVRVEKKGPELPFVAGWMPIAYAHWVATALNDPEDAYYT